MVSSFGMVPQTVASGPDALVSLHNASLQAAPFDLVLMDWRMPGMDGLEVARRIRADRSLSRMPAVLMVTAYGREEVLRRVDQLGLQGLLIKPVTESMMFNVMQGIFGSVPGNGGATPEPVADGTTATLAGHRVLVVDDNALNREVATDFLELAGVIVDTAASGAQALERLARQRYDAVLMDMQMPEMDGLETTRHIRRNPAWSALPVIALTAQARVEDRDASLEAGMTAHLTKPIDDAQLYRTLASIFTGTTPLAAQPAPPEKEAVLDFEAALRRLRGDPERFERLLRGFLRDFSDIPAKLGTVIEARDLPETAALAHLVKGAAGYLEASQLTAAAEALEQGARNGDPGVLAAAFRRHLQAVLDAISARLAQTSSPDAPPMAINHAAVLALIAAIEPLVASGDYAANALLRQLATQLSGQPEAALVDAVRIAFEDVELTAALAGLAQLKVDIAQAG